MTSAYTVDQGTEDSIFRSETSDCKVGHSTSCPRRWTKFFGPWAKFEVVAFFAPNYVVNGNPKMGSPCVSSSCSAMVGKRSLSTWLISAIGGFSSHAAHPTFFPAQQLITSWVNGNPKMGSPCVSSSRSAMVGKRSLSTYIHIFVI